jgi:hypothetical protein
MARKLQPLDLSKDIASDRIEERAAPASLRWTMVLTWFMRLVAILWIMKGLSAWATILGVTPGTPFEGRPTGFQAATIYFAVVDLVAAVGLWMASTWGGVLWLLAVMSHLILAIFFPQIITAGPPTMIFLLGSIAVYLLLSWMSSREG